MGNLERASFISRSALAPGFFRPKMRQPWANAQRLIKQPVTELPIETCAVQSGDRKRIPKIPREGRNCQGIPSL